MAIHYNDNYRSAYQHLQKTLDRLSRFSERKEPTLPTYDGDVLTKQADQCWDDVNGSTLNNAINERSVHSLDQLEEARANTFTDTTAFTNTARSSMEAEQRITAECEHQSKMRSFWVSVSDTEQWHVKEFLPAVHNTNSDRADENFDAIQLKSLFDKYLDKTAILMHGEFGSSRCFYDGHDSGLAWYMAEQGYHVFAIDISGRKRCPTVRQSQSLLQRLKLVFKPSVNSRFINSFLPRTIQACGQRAAVIAAERVAAQLESSSLKDSTKSNLNAELQKMRNLEGLVGSPRAWIAHGFGAAWLAAAWTRLPETCRQAKHMVFFEGYRYWQGGSVLSKGLARLLSSSVLRGVVNVLGRLPVRTLMLGSVDEPTDVFNLYSKWISADEWLDPEDGFDYQQALQENPLPPVLHVMNESEDCLIPGSAVRRFSNELAPLSADLIGIPTSLTAIARECQNAIDKDGNDNCPAVEEIEIPVFSYSGMLLHSEAKNWIFYPMLQWLESSASLAGQSMDAQVPENFSVEQKSELDMQKPATSHQMDLSDLIPTPA